MIKNAIISPKGLDVIKAFEGFRANATHLPNGIWVIGHGHTVSARKGAHVNKEEANTLLLWDMSKLEPKVKDCIFAPVTQAQMDGLLSLAFNIGMDNFANSDVVRFLNEGNILSAASAFDVWRKAALGGRILVIDGLVRRRTAEKALFLDVDGSAVVPAPSVRLRPQDDLELAAEITDEALTQNKANDAVEVSIDLSTSAALGSVLATTATTEDGTPFSFDTEFEAPSGEQPSYYFSDEEFDDVANGNEAPDVLIGEVDDPSVQVETSSDLIPNGDEFVPIGNVFDTSPKTVAPVRAIAEKISGRLSEISPEAEAVTKDVAATITTGSDEVEVPNPPMVDVQEIEAPAEPTQETTPEIDAEEQIESEAEELPPEARLGDFPYDEDAELPPLPVSEELSPDDLTTEIEQHEEQPFAVQERRNTGMFVLMGIVGLILAVGGIFEIRKMGGIIVDQWDWILGPGMAGFGVLLVLAAVYYLVRNVSSNR